MAQQAGPDVDTGAGCTGARARQQRLRTAPWMLEPWPGDQFARHSLMRLLPERADHRQLGLCKDRIPAGCLIVNPAPPPRALGYPSRGGDRSSTVVELLPQGKHPQALAL